MNENFEKVLEFCHDWACVERSRAKGSFIYEVINKIGDQENGISARRFKHFTKDSFVSFCILMRKIYLSDYFHSYYCTVKFVDLLPQMTEDDIGDVCKTFIVHGSLTPAPDHPMTLTLKTMLVHYLNQNLNSIKSENLSIICSYIGTHFHKSLATQCKALQTSMFDQQQMDRHDIKALLSVASITTFTNLFYRTGVDKDFLDALVDRVLGAPVDVIKQQFSTMKDIKKLVEIIAIQRGTPKGRLLVLKLKDIILDRLREKPAENAKNCIRTTLCMAHMGMYDKDLLEILFMSEGVTEPSKIDGGRILARKILYGNMNRKGGINREGGDLMQLKGMVELERPEFKGKLISDLDDSLKLIVTLTPLEVVAGLDADEGDPNYRVGHLVEKGLEVYHSLCKIWGENSVWETYLLPFTGQVNYVLRVNKEMEGVTVGKETREKDKWEVKYVEEENDDVWIAFYLMHPGHNGVKQIRSGGVPVTQRLLERVGFKGVVINLEQWDSMDITEKNYLLKKRVTEKVMGDTI